MNIIESNLSFRSLSYGNKPRMLVLHHAEASTCSIQDIHQWHLDRGWSGCGYHFLVRKDGTVYRGRPEDAIGAHCPGVNATSLGICAEGEYMKEQMPEVQKNAIVELCKYLCSKYGISIIKGHKELYSTDCPGTYYPLQQIKELIGAGGSVSVTTSSTSSSNILRLWSSGSAVRDLQEKLNKLGYSLNADGIYGPNTYNAVEHFQASKGLSVDGIAGQNTLNALNSAYSVFTPNGSIKQLQSLIGANPDNIAGQETLSKCPMLSVGSQGNTVKWLQYVVRVNADGIFGNGTKIAVQNYQAVHGLSADGIVGQATWKKILRL